jgi:hypothetical protein
VKLSRRFYKYYRIRTNAISAGFAGRKSKFLLGCAFAMAKRSSQYDLKHGRFTLGHLYKLPSALADGQIHKWKQALAKN